MTEAVPDWLRERERGSTLGLRMMRAIARRAPAAVSNPLLWIIALYFTMFPKASAMAGSRAYLRAVLNRAPRFGDRHRQVLTFAHVVLDRVGLLADGAGAFEIRATNAELVADLHRRGRGAVLLGAHFGSFEALRAFDRTLPGLVVRYMMFEDNAEKTARLLGGVNPALADQVIALRDGIDAMLAARTALDAGQLVAFLGDRMPRHAPRAEVEVTFFGRPMRLPRAPYLTAMLAEVPVLLCFAPRTGPRAYDIVFKQLHDGSPVPRAERDATCAALAQAYADAVADMCRRHPYNWFNFFDVWR